MNHHFSEPSEPDPAAEVTHAQVSRWLRDAVRSGSSAPPPEELCVHVAGCALCRGTLLAVIAEVAGIPALDPDVTHERCLEELPAFVEEEQASLASALRLYPQVWWHLWVCEACAETYRLTRALAEAERAGEISLPALPNRAGRSKGALLSWLRLARAFLDQAFSPNVPLFEAARGSDHEPIVLTEEIDSEGRVITVSVQPQSDAAWRASVAVAPPPRASVICTLGAWSGRAPLDVEGVAVIPDIPAALLAGPGGPDLVVEVEADE